MQALAEPLLREEGQGAGGAHRSTASLEALYLGTLGPKCPLSHDGRRVTKEGCLACSSSALISPAKITSESGSEWQYLH